MVSKVTPCSGLPGCPVAVWPGDALSILGILAVFLGASFAAARMLQQMLPAGAQVAAKNV